MGAGSVKGQGAMEYLLTYGWAIIVVMIVGFAMWTLGVFNIGESATMTTTGFGIIKPQLASCSLQSGTGDCGACTYPGVFKCVFTNAASVDIILTNITGRNIMRDRDCTDLKVVTSAGTYYVAAGDPCPIPGGDNFVVYLYQCELDSTQPGEPYILEVDIEYNITIDEAETVRHSVGTIRGSYT